MRKYFYLSSLILVLLLTIALMSSVPMTVQAIGEVTATPAPEEPREDIDPDEVDIEVLIDEALQDLQEGRFRSAIANMDIVLEVDPENSLAYLIRGVAHVQLSQYSDAIDNFTEAIELEPWEFDFYLIRGDAYYQQGELVDALLDYEMAIGINPLNPNAFARRSEINYELGDNRAGDADDLLARGISAFINGDILSALDFLTEVIDATDDGEVLASAYYVRGIIFLNTGDNDAALEEFTLAIEADPTLHNSYLARGIAYREDGDMQAAGEDFYNRITIHGAETIEIEAEIGERLEIDMAYRRVYAISFEGEAGQEITITARDFGGSFIDPLIALVDPNGEPIAGDDDFGGGLDSEIDDFELPEDGTYTLYVSHAEGGYDFGFQGIVRVDIDD